MDLRTNSDYFHKVGFCKETVLCEVRTDSYMLWTNFSLRCSVVSLPKLTSKFSPKCGPDDVIRISEFLHNAASPPPPNYKFRPNAQLLFSTAHCQQRTSRHDNCFPSHHFTFSSACLYQQDKRAMPRKLQGSKLFSFPLNNILPLTMLLLLLSSVSFL